MSVMKSLDWRLRMALVQGAVLIVDKPKGFTCRQASAEALAQFKTWTTSESSKEGASKSGGSSSHNNKRRKGGGRSGHDMRMGHAGTLDPMATGCLPVLLGQATKLQDLLPIDRKRYIAHLRLGVKTDSDDADGNVLRVDDKFTGIDLDFNFEPILEKFRGTVTQIPPIYSAIHIDGKRAFDLARAGETPTMPPRQVQVYSFTGRVLDQNTLVLDVTCGTGTYVRTLGTDVAKALGTEGHLVMLRRVSSGPFDVLESRRLPQEEGPEIVRVLSFEETIKLIAQNVDFSGNKRAQENLLTGRSNPLFRDLNGLVRRKENEEIITVAISWQGYFRALVKVDFTKQAVSSICHFKEEETFPFVPSLMERKFSSENEPIDELRVAQFNVLADGLSARRPDLGGFDDVSAACLNWTFRCQRILQEVQRCRPHILCMEELDHLDSISKGLGSDYSSVFMPKLHSPCLEVSPFPDGSAIFFDTTRLRRVDLGADEINGFPLGQGDSQVAACVVLEDIKDPKYRYIVCAAHLKAKKDAEGVGTAIRVRQAKELLNRIEGVKNKFVGSEVIVCADLNGVPTGEAYNLLSSSLISAMAEVHGGKEPDFTTTKKRKDSSVRHTIDYIFYGPSSSSGSNRLNVKRHLEIPPAELVGELPSWHYPSDHLLLCVGFSRL